MLLVCFLVPSLRGGGLEECGKSRVPQGVGNAAKEDEAALIDRLVIYKYMVAHISFATDLDY